PLRVRCCPGRSGLGVRVEPWAMATLVAEEGFGLFYAPRYHPALRHAGPVRKALGIPTIFNFLGPLANPAGVLRYALGVSDQKMAEKMIRVLASLGADTAFVVHGEDGLDEVTTSGPTYILRLKDGEITHAEFTPEDFGVERAPLSELIGGDVDANVEITRSILAGKGGPRRDAANINAAVGLVAEVRAEGLVAGDASAIISAISCAVAYVLT